MSTGREVLIKENELKYTITQATGSSAISATISAPESGKGFSLKEVRVSLSDVGGTGNLTITIDNGTNAVYDHVLLTQDMTSVKYLRYVPAEGAPIPLKSTDKIVIAYTNSNSRTYGIEVITVPHY